MNDDRLASFVSEVADGSLRKGFLVVSQSNYWTPWMVGPVKDRIEIGLFEEYLGYPRSPAFALNWAPNNFETPIEVRASAEAWCLLPLLDGISDIFSKAGLSIDEGALSVNDVKAMLQEAGFVESEWEYPEANQLPLPPEEKVPSSAPPLSVNFRRDCMPCEDEVQWVGPHIGRTSRFMSLIEEFVASLNAQGVAAQDIKAEYTDSAFHRL